MGLQGVVTCPANRKSDGFDSRIVHQLRYIQQSIINLTQGKSAAERLRRCKSYPRPPLWASSEVDKHSGVVFLSVSCEYASIAQLVEHSFHRREVMGSSPVTGTKGSGKILYC